MSLYSPSIHFLSTNVKVIFLLNFIQAEASVILVGYPDFIKDEQLLNAEYEAVSLFAYSFTLFL